MQGLCRVQSKANANPTKKGKQRAEQINPDLLIGKNKQPLTNQPNQSPRLLRNHPAPEGQAGCSSFTKPSLPEAGQNPDNLQQLVLPESGQRHQTGATHQL